MRLAAIDIGSNSIHMIVVQVRPDLSFEVIDREKDMVRLGAGGLDGKRLTDSAVAAGLAAMSKFKRLADSHEVDEIIAAATSATREASNGGDFLAAIAETTGIRVRVITGVEEARLIHLAAVYGTDLAGGTAVVIDIGGGSVEITRGTATATTHARSFKMGAIRLAERFVRTDPLSARDERRLERHVHQQADAYLAQITKRGFTRVIGTSGTILSLGLLATMEERGDAPDDLRNVRVSARALHRLRKTLTSHDLQERLAIPGMDPRRADLSVGGAVLLDTLITQLGTSEFTLCDLALREGLILDYIADHRGQIAQLEKFPDLRLRSTHELAERCRAELGHASQVARLALALFDQLQERHHLGVREREWLECASLLHDIGMMISHEGHDKHSYYLIKHGDLRGFEPDEIEVIALLGRYHRSGKPKKSNDAFRRLRRPMRDAVRTLAPFLALAEALDRSHANVIDRLEVVEDADQGIATITVTARNDAELELWAAQRHVRPLEAFLECPVRIERASSHAANAVVTTSRAKAATRRTPGARRQASAARGRRRTRTA
jgi:exopolyphosphatase/guanosine-5'-triphosphate,3'-diphosphate pyrophosphatase